MTNTTGMNAYNYCRSIGMSIGHSTGSSSSNSSYAQNIANCLNACGMQIARIEAWDGGSDLQTMQDIQALIPNVGFVVCILAYANGAVPLWSSNIVQAALAQMPAAGMVYLEGPNEMNGGVGGGSFAINSTNTGAVSFSASMYQGWAQGIFSFVQGSSAFASGPYVTGKNLAIIAPALANGNSADSVGGNVNAYVDYGQIHGYTEQAPFNANTVVNGDYGEIQGLYKNSIQYNTPSRPVVPTEIGHHTNGQDGADYITENCQAKMILNCWHDLLTLGSPLMVIYCDQDNTTYSGGVNAGDQNAYGICHVLPAQNSQIDSTQQAKVGGRAIKTLTTLMSDPNGKSYVPSAYPNYAVTGLTATCQYAANQFCVAKSDGSFYIIIWNEPQVCDGNQPSNDVTPPNNYVTVNFGGTYTWEIYDPLNPISNMSCGPGTGYTPQSTVDSFATQGTTAITSGTGSSISGTTLNILGYPKVIKLNAVTVTKAPGTVTGLTSSGNLGRSVTINWTAATNYPSYYTLLQGTSSTGPFSSIFSNINGTSQTVTGLTPNGTVYYYVVTATNSIGTSANSTALSVTTATIPPESPNGTTVTTVGPTIIGYDGTSYAINSAGQVTQNGVADTNTSSVVELYFLNNTFYQENTSNNWYSKTYITDAYTQVASPIGTVAPTQVTNLNVGTIGSTSLSFSWTAVANATSYELDSSTNGTTFTTFSTSITGTTATVTGLSSSTNYYARVRAANAAGNGPYSATFGPQLTASPGTVAIIQTAQGFDQTGTGTTTVTMPNNTTVGNTMFLIYMGQGGNPNTSENTAVTIPAGFSIYLGPFYDDTAGDNQITVFKQTVTSATNTFAITHYSDLTQVFGIEVSGSFTVDNSHGLGAETSSPQAITWPIHAPVSTPAISLVVVATTYRADTYGSPSSGITALQVYPSGGTSGAFAYHVGALMQVANGTTGTGALNYSFTSGGAYLGNPVYFSMNLYGSGGSGSVVPNQITNLSAVGASTTSITTSWSIPANTPTSFVLQYRVTGSTTWLAYSGNPISGSATTATVTGLVSNTEYDFTIYGVNSAGNATLSNIAQAYTIAAGGTATKLKVNPSTGKLRIRGTQLKLGV
jgi:hypothetical protein